MTNSSMTSQRGINDNFGENVALDIFNLRIWGRSKGMLEQNGYFLFSPPKLTLYMACAKSQFYSRLILK